MSFASPWLLLTALGAAVPVLIHLYGQRRARRVPFPSLMLLRRAERERSSLSRLRQIWLMLLRALAILCLALALAQPSLTGLHMAGMAGSTVVFLLDDSASMQARGPARTAFDVARRTLTDTLGQLPATQTVVLQRLSAADQSLKTASREVATAALEALRPGFRAVDMPAALSRLWDAVGDGELREARWVLLTDLQASGWRGELRPAPWVSSLLVVDCGADGPNVTVTGLDLVEPPALVGRPLQLRVTVRAWPSTQYRAPVPVSVTINDKALPPASCRLVRGRGEALVEWLPRAPGLLRVKASVPGDRLEADNSAYLVVEVRDRLRVTVLGTEAQSRWARLALSPGPPAPVQVQHADTASPATLAGQDVAFVVGAAGNSSAAALRAFAEGGGGLVLCLPGAATLARDILKASDGRIGAVVTPAAPTRIGTFDSFRPPLQAFANAAAGDLREPAFRRYVELSVPTTSRWRVSARYDNQVPALLNGHVGEGRVLVANFEPTPGASDLPSLPVFVPLLHRLVGFVARGPRPEEARVLVGEARGPDVGAAERPGFVDRRVVAGGSALAVNLDPLEGDLRRFAAADLQRRCAPVKVSVCNPDELPGRLQGAPVPLATPLWLLGLGLLVLELFLLRRPGAKGVTTPRLEMGPQR